MNRYIPLKEAPEAKVIFETDLCGDVDDVGAMALLCDLVRRKGLDLAGISVNVNGPGEGEATDTLLERFGLPQLPICVWDGDLFEDFTPSRYVDYLSALLPPHRRATLQIQSPVEFYRDLLTSADDHSVVIISVGFFCNLNVAYQAMPALFAQKVRAVVVMAGSFEGKPGYREYNIRKMADHAYQFLSGFPGQLLYLPSEAGDQVITDLRRWPADPADPICESYRLHTQDKMTRPSWDLQTVEFAYFGENDYYELSPWGTATVTPDSFTSFRAEAGGNHAVIKLKRSFEETGAHISDVLSRCCGIL